MSTEEPSDPPEHGLHIIIKGDLHTCELFPEISNFPRCAVVEHKEGRKQKERPHYHCWLPFEAPTKATELEWKLKCRTYYDSVLSGLNWNRNANAYYTVKCHDSYKRWFEYVVRDPDVKISSWIKWNREGEPPPILVEIPIVAQPTNSLVIIPKMESQRKEACHLRFWKWLQNQEVEDDLSITEIQEYWIEWTSGAYELRNVSAPIRYAWYMLQTDKEAAKTRLVREMSRKIFENF